MSIVDSVSFFKRLQLSHYSLDETGFLDLYIYPVYLSL